MQEFDSGTDIACVRALRDLVTSNSVLSQRFLSSNSELIIELCRLYALKRYGGQTQAEAHKFVREVISRSQAPHINAIYSSKDLTPSVRLVVYCKRIVYENIFFCIYLTLHTQV